MISTRGNTRSSSAAAKALVQAELLAPLIRRATSVIPSPVEVSRKNSKHTCEYSQMQATLAALQLSEATLS